MEQSARPKLQLVFVNHTRKLLWRASHDASTGLGVSRYLWPLLLSLGTRTGRSSFELKGGARYAGSVSWLIELSRPILPFLGTMLSKSLKTSRKRPSLKTWNMSSWPSMGHSCFPFGLKTMSLQIRSKICGSSFLEIRCERSDAKDWTADTSLRSRASIVMLAPGYLETSSMSLAVSGSSLGDAFRTVARTL